jgi:hypothetical protein
MTNSRCISDYTSRRELNQGHTIDRVYPQSAGRIKLKEEHFVESPPSGFRAKSGWPQVTGVLAPGSRLE